MLSVIYYRRLCAPPPPLEKTDPYMTVIFLVTHCHILGALCSATSYDTGDWCTRQVKRPVFNFFRTLRIAQA